MQEQRGDDEKPFEPADVQAGVLQFFAAFAGRLILDAFGHAASEIANQVAAAENDSHINDRHHEPFGLDGAGKANEREQLRQSEVMREKPSRENDSEEVNELVGRIGERVVAQ